MPRLPYSLLRRWLRRTANGSRNFQRESILPFRSRCEPATAATDIGVQHVHDGDGAVYWLIQGPTNFRHFCYINFFTLFSIWARCATGVAIRLADPGEISGSCALDQGYSSPALSTPRNAAP